VNKKILQKNKIVGIMKKLKFYTITCAAKLRRKLKDNREGSYEANGFRRI